MNNTVIAKVVIDKTVYRFDKLFDYIVPNELISICRPGCRVTVPFGRTNSKRQGLVMELCNAEKSDLSGYKNIMSVIDTTPILNEEALLMVKWLKSHTFCTYFDAVKTLVPFGLNLSIVSRLSLNSDVSPETVSTLSETAGKIVGFLRKKGGSAEKKAVLRHFGLNDDTPFIGELITTGVVLSEGIAKQNMRDPTVNVVRLNNRDDDFSSLTQKQKSVVELLLDIDIATVKEICYFTGVTSAVINTLQKKGFINVFSAPVYHNYSEYGEGELTKINLTDEQFTAFDKLKSDLQSEEAKVNLLYGVTGSGKTSIFLKLVDETLSMGKTAIVMVPEISLTPQTLSKFRARYGKKVAVFHSAMSMSQRTEQYKRAARGEALVAIGTRSAVFAPLKDIGLIVMDEEQEHTYKSEQSPRFHARDVAKFRINYHNAMLLLASATPSVESFSLAKSGKYGLLTLKHRYGNAILPEVLTVDMLKEISEGNTGIFSRKLVDELSNVLGSGKQAILLLNRRGHNTYVSCPSCGNVFNCPNCSISLTYHSANRRLMCHYCGSSYPVPTECPTCKNKKLRFSGVGTQRADEELSALFPKARILRLDADTTMSRDAFEKGLTAFGNGEYDIMLGTQMVAKGLDFPKVTVVGVLSADQSMYSDDYRAFERTFSLLTQVIGRSGRGENPGLAIVQTSSPESEIINLACEQDYESFYNTEIMTRRLMVYPPYCDIVMLVVSAFEQATAVKFARLLFDIIKTLPEKSGGRIKMIVLGPTAANVPMVNKKHRQRILIKTKNTALFRKLISDSLIEFYENAGKNVSVFVDINPESII